MNRDPSFLYGPCALIIVVLSLTAGLCAKGIGADITPAVFRPEQTPALPAGFWLAAQVTAYCGGPCKECQTTGTIANGTSTTRVPYALAADRSLPMGSRVYIPAGIGYLDRLRPSDRVFTVDDRGGALDTEALASGVFRIDLRFIGHADAKRFGRRMVDVYVFTNN